MADQIYSVPRLPDTLVLSLFRTIVAKHRPAGCSVEPAGLVSINFLNPNPEEEQTLKRLDADGSYAIARVHLHYHGMIIYYIRGGEVSDQRRSSSVLDEIKIARQDNQPNPIDAQTRLDVIDIILATTGLPKDGTPIALGTGRSLEELDALYRATVLRLETSFAAQIDKITSWTVEKAGEIQKQEIKLGEETAAERGRLQKEFEEAREKLKLKDEELEARNKALDDRDYMHARRQTRSDIQKVIAERQTKFTLTPQTTRLRFPIHLMLTALCVALLGLALFNFSALIETLSPNSRASQWQVIWLMVKQGTFSFGFVIAVYGYIRWMNRWFEQHANAEFLLKEFQLDIDRASWVVETALEWRRIAEAELPAPLLTGITRNLFARTATDDQNHTAADDLASALMGSAAGLKLKLGENELNFTRRGLKSLAGKEIRDNVEG